MRNNIEILVAVVLIALNILVGTAGCGASTRPSATIRRVYEDPPLRRDYDAGSDPEILTPPSWNGDAR